jgi:hypothetical protein
VVVLPNGAQFPYSYVDQAGPGDDDPGPGGTYSYVVCAVNDFGRNCADPVSVTVN